MSIKLAAVLLAAVAIAAPSAPAHAKDKGKDKDRSHAEGRDDDRDSDRGDRDDRDDRGDRGDGQGKVTLCHVPPGNPANRHTITVGAAAWTAHRRHGDHRGPCRPHAGSGTDSSGRVEKN
jgi:hypothetical protein